MPKTFMPLIRVLMLRVRRPVRIPESLLLYKIRKQKNCTVPCDLSHGTVQFLLLYIIRILFADRARDQASFLLSL